MSITLNAKVQRTEAVDAAVRQFLLRNYVTTAKPAKTSKSNKFATKHKGKHNALGQWR